ncbi:extracellular solute-binding protein [Brachybacterium sacelli]|uniref:Aldouronate transport system substrate-binding protein n=1 Tax=Brachybacterium sacelli TaxID=173364 RepID=A0ABS4X208_9MICO|nr:extracellular solute-binding protein [Brachybacterium sacelli]MBP2382428.1 putative aldouronate transport system substrate-binding protein [Brachybacterium sacelli]
MTPQHSRIPTSGPLSRRALLAGATALPVGAAMAGCSGDGTSSTAAPQVEYAQGSAALEVGLGAEIDGVPYPEGYVGPRARESEPFGDGSTSFAITTRSLAGFDPSTNWFSAFLERETGVKVSYSTVPRGDEGAPKVNAILAGGELPDALMLGPEWMGGFTKSELYVYGQQGLFLALDELFDRFAPQLQEVFSQNPEFRKAWTAPDGAMYAFPSVNQCYHCKSSPFRTWVHTPSREAAGFAEQPATLEEFEQMLRGMKEADPEIRPMSGGKDDLPLRLIGAAFLDLGVNQLRRDGDAIVFTPTDPAMRDVFRTAAHLVREGLLDRNAFTQTTDQLIRLGMHEAGSRFGVCQGVSQGSFVDVEYTDPEARYREFEPLQPFAGPGGDPVIAWDDQPGAGSVGLVIPADTADPETLVRWADFQLGLLSTLSMRLGPKGDFWTWAEAGDLGIDEGPALYKKVPQEKEAQNIGWEEHGVFNLALDVRHGEAVDEMTSFEPMLYRAGKMYEKYAAAPEALFIAPFFDQDQAAQVGELRTNIDAAYVRGATSMCLGELDPESDADWESYLSSLSDAGVDQYLEVLTEADTNQA